MIGSGWLQAKKRGRDDAVIAKDRTKALAARRQASKPRQKKDEDLDDFIVEDDKDSSEPEFSQGESEEDLVIDEEDSVSIVAKKTSQTLEDSEEEEETFLKQPPFFKKRKSRPPTTSIQKAKTTKVSQKPTTKMSQPKEVIYLKDQHETPQRMISLSAEDDDSIPSSSKLKKNNPNTSSRFFTQQRQESTPTDVKPRTKPKKKRAIRDDSDDDDDFFNVHYPKGKTSKPDSASLQDTVTKKPRAELVELLDDVPSDPDEAIALKWALRESLSEGEAMLESDDEEQDEYVDEEAKTAGSVLATANDLSAQVLKTMSSWYAGDEPTGMIVDGALSMFDMAETTKHDFISEETMREICPDVKLAKYQLIGINWLALLHSMKCEVEGQSKHTNVNGVLADEMGLGKTCQTICFLAWLKYANKQKKCRDNTGHSISERTIAIDDEDEDSIDGFTNNKIDNMHLPHLVVAPASVLSNWEREFEKFAPKLNIVKYHGNLGEREELQENLQMHLPKNASKRKKLRIEPVDVILVPVTYFQKEKSDDRVFLKKFRFDYMIVDEAHVLKDAKGRRYKSLTNFSSQHRLLLTGTPVQNSPKELMALLTFLMPLFDQKKRADDFDNAKGTDGGESMLRHFVSLEGGKIGDDESAYRKLKQLFAPFVLRRRKQDVLNQILPPKERTVEFVDLDPRARSVYNSILEDHLKKKQKSAETSREHLFTQLRKAAHHPLLLRSRYTSKEEKERLVRNFHQCGAFRGESLTAAKVAEELEKWNDFDIHVTALDLISENKHRQEALGCYILDEEDLFASAKLARLRTLLPDLIAKGHRILIFSGWTSCLDLLSCLLEVLAINHLRMEGSTAVSERQELMDTFNKDDSIKVFLLSTRACGLGINLTSADVCIIHDLDFNPFNDLQAEDRCHRIGQKKPVKVIKMVSRETVDEAIYNMQERKTKMNAAIMESKPNELKKTAEKEKEELLKSAVVNYLRSPEFSRKPSGKENKVAPLSDII